jgi:hypothetical protein
MTLRRTSWVLALLAACQFDDTGLYPVTDALGPSPDGPIAASDASVDAPVAIDAAVDAGDDPVPVDARVDATVDARPDAGPPPIADDVAHVPDDGEFAGTADLALATALRIDTTALTIDDAAPPAGVVFDVWPQDGGGPELAVLHVRRLDVAATGRVRVTGRRPLVVIAGADIVVAGIIDAGARRSEPGAGGAAAGGGPGAGGIGRTSLRSDSGGGGGGHGATGASGGDAGCDLGGCSLDGGAAGVAYGAPTLAILQGGSGGGATPMVDGCAPKATGAGGGAIQLYAATTIRISGAIGAGGGGGAGGSRCASNWAAGGGGGAGGAIYLQAPALALTGIVAANGGGGGGSAGETGAGGDGSDGGLDTLRALGGRGGGRFSASGGLGGARAGTSTTGQDGPTAGNAGGGGAAVGRIVIRTRTPMTTPGEASASPVPNVGSY